MSTPVRLCAAFVVAAALGTGCAETGSSFAEEGERRVDVVPNDLETHPCGHHMIPERDGYIWSSIGTLPPSWTGVVSGTLSWSGTDGIVTADDGTTLAYRRERAEMDCDIG